MRFDHLRVVWPYLLGATLLVACDVDLREGWFRCDSHGACPEGWTCRDDGRCWSTPSDSKVEPATRPDAGEGPPRADAGPDAASDATSDAGRGPGCVPGGCADPQICVAGQ